MRACCCVPDRLPVHVPEERYTVRDPDSTNSSDNSSTELVNKTDPAAQEHSSYTDERIDIEPVVSMISMSFHQLYATQDSCGTL